MRWKLRKLAFGGLLLAALSFGFSQPAASQTTDERMTQLEEEIWSSLDSLKRNSTSLIDELDELKRLREISDQKLTDLQSSLRNTLDAYNSLGQQLQNTRVDLQKKQRQVRKLTIILIVAGVLAIAARGVILYLKAKGVEIPYIINTII